MGARVGGVAAARRRRSVSALLQARVAVFRESVFSVRSGVAGAAVFSADCSRLPPVVSSTEAGGWVASASRPRGWRRSVGGRLTVPAAIGSIIRSYGQSWQVGSRVAAVCGRLPWTGFRRRDGSSPVALCRLVVRRDRPAARQAGAEQVRCGAARVAGADVFSAVVGAPLVVSSTGVGGWVEGAFRPRGWCGSAGGR